MVFVLIFLAVLVYCLSISAVFIQVSRHSVDRQIARVPEGNPDEHEENHSHREVLVLVFAGCYRFDALQSAEEMLIVPE